MSFNWKATRLNWNWERCFFCQTLFRSTIDRHVKSKFCTSVARPDETTAYTNTFPKTAFFTLYNCSQWSKYIHKQLEYGQTRSTITINGQQTENSVNFRRKTIFDTNNAIHIFRREIKCRQMNKRKRKEEWICGVLPHNEQRNGNRKPKMSNVLNWPATDTKTHEPLIQWPITNRRTSFMKKHLPYDDRHIDT